MSGRFMSQVNGGASQAVGRAAQAVSDSASRSVSDSIAHAVSTSIHNVSAAQVPPPKISRIKDNFLLIIATVVLGVALIYFIMRLRKMDKRVVKVEKQTKGGLDDLQVESIVGKVLSDTEKVRQERQVQIAKEVSDESSGKLLGYLYQRGIIQDNQDQKAEQEEERIQIVEEVSPSAVKDQTRKTGTGRALKEAQTEAQTATIAKSLSADMQVCTIKNGKRSCSQMVMNDNQEAEGSEYTDDQEGDDGSLYDSEEESGALKNVALPTLKSNTSNSEKTDALASILNQEN